MQILLTLVLEELLLYSLPNGKILIYNNSLYFGGESIIQKDGKMMYGSYTGTGLYGKNNPNVLNFDFEVQLVILCGSNPANVATFIFPRDNFSFGSYADVTMTLKNNGKTFEWYSTENAIFQANNRNNIYYYEAM